MKREVIINYRQKQRHGILGAERLTQGRALDEEERIANPKKEVGKPTWKSAISLPNLKIFGGLVEHMWNERTGKNTMS